MTISDHVGDCVDFLDSSWNTGTVSKPEITDGKRLTNDKNQITYPSNYVLVFDGGINTNYVDAERTYQDEFYSLILEAGTSETGTKRDNIVSECQRILGLTGVTGYDNFAIRRIDRMDNDQEFVSKMRYDLVKYSQAV